MREVKAAFNRYIGIEYSGAETCDSSLKGLRVYMADHSNEPREIAPPPSPRRYWTRKAIAEWLVERLSEPSLTLVGIDHGFSFPLRYFEKYGVPLIPGMFASRFTEDIGQRYELVIDCNVARRSANGELLLSGMFK